MEINGLHMDHHSNGQVRSNNGDHRVLNVLCVSSLWLLDINITGNETETCEALLFASSFNCIYRYRYNEYTRH